MPVKAAGVVAEREMLDEVWFNQPTFFWGRTTHCINAKNHNMEIWRDTGSKVVFVKKKDGTDVRECYAAGICHVKVSAVPEHKVAVGDAK